MLLDRLLLGLVLLDRLLLELVLLDRLLHDLVSLAAQLMHFLCSRCTNAATSAETFGEKLVLGSHVP